MSQQQGENADRGVDEEDVPPAGVGPEDRDDRPAQQRTDGRRDTDGGPEQPEGLAPLRAPEHLLDQAAHLRCQHAAREALDQPGDHEQCRRRREAAGDAGQGEQGEPDLEGGAPATGVPQATGRDEQQPERQRVARHDPRQGVLAGAQTRLDAGQRDVDDADVEQCHEPGHQADRQGLPPVRVGQVGLLGSGTGRAGTRGGHAHAGVLARRNYRALLHLFGPVVRAASAPPACGYAPGRHADLGCRRVVIAVPEGAEPVDGDAARLGEPPFALRVRSPCESGRLAGQVAALNQLPSSDSRATRTCSQTRWCRAACTARCRPSSR